MLLDYTVDQNNIDIEREDINFVGRLIKGEQPKEPDHEKCNFNFYCPHKL